MQRRSKYNYMQEESDYTDRVADILDLRTSDKTNESHFFDILPDYAMYGSPEHEHSDDFRVSGDEEIDQFTDTADFHQTNGAKTSLKGQSIETTSTYDSKHARTSAGVSSKGIRKRKYETLNDEGKFYEYDDDPKRYMQIRK